MSKCESASKLQPLAAVVLTVLVVSGLSAGTTYYVSPTGSASNPGTHALPWSLGKANSDLQPGDTAILMDGSYSEYIAPANNGAPGSPITYKAENTHQAVFDGTTYSAFLTGRGHIVVDGIKAINMGSRWVRAEGGQHHITVNDCYFENAPGWESMRFRRSGDGIRVTNCHIENGSDSLHIREGENHYVAGNTFIRDSHTCLILMGVKHSVVENNSLENPGQKLMEVFSLRQGLPPNEKKSEYNVIQNNWFGPTPSSGIQYAGNRMIVRRNLYVDCGAGMNFANYGGTDPGDDPEAWWDEENRFYHNVMYACRSGISCGTYQRLVPLGGLYGDNVAVNNIIAGGSNAGQVSFSSHALPTHLLFFHNNIIRSSPGQDVFYWVGGEPYYTLAEMEAVFPSNYADNMEAAPQFVNPAGEDFHLQPGSPMIDAGGPLTHALGNGRGYTVPVADALYFTDGYGVIAPDVLRIGGQRATVVTVDYANNNVTVDREVSWTPGMPVCLDFNGSAPDLGAFETDGVSGDVAGRHVFYNNSIFDGNDAAANAADDGAIATDKEALRPGQKATFANYTSYSRGINGIMIDVDGLAGTPTAADFEFRVGNDNDPTGWAGGPAPVDVAVRAGAGVGGSDRVSLVWADEAIKNQWLEVTVKATEQTGLVRDDVFYFGNAIGETGNSPDDAEVTPTDQIHVRNHPHTNQNPCDVTDPYDFNRDSLVTPSDEIICRENGASSLTALRLIDLFVNQAPIVDAGDNQSIFLPVNTADLDGTVSDDGYPLDPGSVTTLWSKVSGPGDVTFGDATALDTTATFSAKGLYVLQLEANDGELSSTDTVAVEVIDPTGLFFEDDFEDGDLAGWTTLEGEYETLVFLTEPGYEVHALVRDSRMRADLTDTSLSDTVYISFTVRHTGGAGGSGGTGWKAGRMWFVDDSGEGFGLYMALEQSGSGQLELVTTTDDGDTDSGAGGFSNPGSADGNDKKTVELIYDRVDDEVECIYQGLSKGTVTLGSEYRDFTRVVVNLVNEFDGWYGQLNVDDIRIASTPPE